MNHSRTHRTNRNRIISTALSLVIVAATVAISTGFTRGNSIPQVEVVPVIAPEPIAAQWHIEPEENYPLKIALLKLEHKNAANESTDIPKEEKAAQVAPEAPVTVLDIDYGLYSEADVIALAQMAYGEAWVTQSDTEMAASMWCALNRLDSGDPFYASCDSVYDIVSQNMQFHGYSPNHPVMERLENLARDVLSRWAAEKAGATDVGRTLPAEFCFFYGDGFRNHYTTEYQGGITYDWSLNSPYET